MSADIHHDESETIKPLEPQQIDAFWGDFSNQLSQLEELDRHEFVESSNELLHLYAPGLSLELEGKLGEAGSRLVISAHGNTAQFENAQALVRQAPRFEHYSVQAFRSRALGSNFGMRMDGFELACSDIRVGYYDAGGIIGLKLSFEKPIARDMAEHAQHMAFIMLDHVLGEWDFSVRVGPVEFASEAAADVYGSALLSEFPPLFDGFIRQQLGRSYEFPQEDSDRWLSLEVRAQDAEEDAPPDILTFHDGANAVATRADLSHFMEWRFSFSSQQELDGVRDAQDALDEQLSREQRGILAFSRVENMSARVATYYVEDPAHAVQLAAQLGRQHVPGLEGELSVSFDPSWNEFLSLYAAIHRNDRPEEVLAS